MSNKQPRVKSDNVSKRKNLAALLARVPLLESLERREMMAVLSASEKAGLREAFQALTGFTTNLEQSELLNTKIPIIDKKIGDVVDIDQLVRQQFLNPLEKFLDTAQPTSEDLQKLFQSGLSGVSNVALGKMATLPTLIPNVSFAASFDIDLTKSYKFEYDLGAQLKEAGVEVQVGKVSTNLDFELHFGASIDIDLSKIGGAPSDIVKFTLKDGTKTEGSRIVAKATSTLSSLDATVGVIGASVNNAALVLDVVLPMDFGAVAAPAQVFSLSALKTTAASVPGVFGLKTDSSANKSLQLSLPLTITVGDSRIVDNKALIVKDDDLFDRKFDLKKTGPSVNDPNVYIVIPPEVKDFRAMGSAAIFGIVQKLGDYFGDISQSEVFQTEIPFTDGMKVGDIVNLRGAFEEKVVNKARESAKNTAGQIVDAATQIAEDARNYAFKNVQDLATRIGNKLNYKSDDFNGDGIGDPRLEFDIDFNHVVQLPQAKLNFNVDLGELAKFGIDKSSLNISAQVDAQFDFIVLLRAPGSEDGDKIADVLPDGSVAFRKTKLLSTLNNGGDLLSGVGKDFRVTLSDGTTFEVELDKSIIPITTATKAKVSENAQGDLTNQITFAGTPNLADVNVDHVLSIINRTDGKERTDRFSIVAIDRTTNTLTVSPTPTAGTGEFEWAIDEPPTNLGQIIDRIQSGGAAAATKFELTANGDQTGLRIVDKTATGSAAGASKLKVEVLGSSRAAIALGIAGTGSAPKDGDPVAIEGASLHGKTILDNVFIRNFQVDAAANLNASIDQASASLGIVGVNITNGKGVARAGVSLAVHDPGPSFDGRVTLSEAGQAVRDMATRLIASNAVAFPVKPSGTLTANIQGKDNDFKIDIGQSTDAASLVAKINAAPGFAALATAKVVGTDVVLTLKFDGLTTNQRQARRITVQQSSALGLNRNEVHHESVTLKPSFPLVAGTFLTLTIAQDDLPNPVSITFDGSVEYTDLKTLTDDIAKKLEGKPLSVSSSGGKLTFNLNNGNARAVDIDTVMPELGITSPLKGYLVRPGINGSASFELPFKIETSLPIPGLDVGSKIGVTLPDINKPKEIKIEFPNVSAAVRDRLNSLKKLDFSTVIQGVSAGLEYLKSLDISGFALPLFNQEIPLLGINLRDSLDLALKFNDFLIEFQKDPISKLNELAEKIRVGIKAKTVRFSYDDGVIPGLSTKRPALRLDIAYATPNFEQDLPMNLDLSSIDALKALGGLVDVSSTGQLRVKAGAEITLSLGFDLSDPIRPKPFLYTNDVQKVIGGAAANTLTNVNLDAKTVTLKTGTDMTEFVAGDWIKLSGSKTGRVDSDQKPELFKISRVDIANRRVTVVGELDAGVTTSSVWTLKRRGLVASAGGDANSRAQSVSGKVVEFPVGTDMSLFRDGGWLKIAGSTGGVTDDGEKNLFKIVSVDVPARKVTMHTAPGGPLANTKPQWSLLQEVGTGVSLTADADASNINFISSFGPLGIEVRNGNANIFPTGESPTAQGGATFQLGLHESSEANPDGRRYLNEFAFSQGPVTVIESDGRKKFGKTNDSHDKFTLSLGTKLLAGETAVVKLEIDDPNEALFAVKPAGQFPTDADFKSTAQVTFTSAVSRFTVFVKGVDDTIKDRKKTSTITISVDKTSTNLPADLRNAKNKTVSVVTIDDEVLAKEEVPTVTRTGEFETIIGASFGLKDLGIDTSNLKGTIQQAMDGQVQATLPIKLKGIQTRVAGKELLGNGTIGGELSTSDPNLVFSFTLADMLNKGFKPTINIATPAGKVIVNDDGSTPFVKLVTGGIEELKNGGLKNLVAMVGGWEGAFDHLIDAMNGEVFGITLPLVGDKLKEQAKFLEDMKSKVSAGLQAINDAEGYLKEKVQEVIFAGLGPEGINFVKDAHSEDGTLWKPDGKITKEDVGIRILRDGGTLPTGVRFEMQLGKDIAFSTSPNVDVGVPGLSLKVDAPIQGNINLDFVLMVGVDGDAGFFIETGMADELGNLIGAKDAQGNPLTKELTIGVDVSTPGLTGSGTLGFLSMSAKDLPGARIGVQNADGTQSFPLLVTAIKPDRSLEGVKFAFQTVASKDNVTATYDAGSRTLTFFVEQQGGKIVTTAKELKDKANQSESFKALFSMNTLGDANKVIVPTGSTLQSTAKDANGKAKQPVVIVPKAPDANLANIRYVFQTPKAGQSEAVIYDNVTRTITFRVAAGKKASQLVAIAANADSASFSSAFSAILVESSLADEVISTATKQVNLGAVTKITPSNFSAKFEVDLVDDPKDKDTKLTIPEAARLKRNAIDFSVSGTASLNFRLQTNLGDVAMPGVRADVNLDWRFRYPKDEIAAANAGRPAAAGRKLPNLPDMIAINNVEINLGEFFNNFAGTTLKKVKEILEPLDPFFKLVSDPLPVISDLAGSPVSLLDVARLFGGSVGQAVKFIDAVKRLKDLVDTIPTDLGADNWLRIGGFEIDTSSLRGANAAVDSLTTRIPALKNINASNAEQLAKDMQQKVKDASAQAKAKNFNAGKFTKSAGSFKEGDFNVAFPVLSNPASLFSLLVGQDIDLVTLELPVFGLKAEMKRQFRGPGALAFLTVEVGGSIEARVDLAFGYDTSGIRKFLNTKKVTDVFDGFFLTDHEKPDGSGPDIPEVQILGALTVSAGADFGIASAKVGGGIYANVDFNLHDDNDDSKVRVNELVENAQLEAPVPGLHIFDVSGSVKAGAFATVSVLGLEKTWESPKVTLVDFVLDRPGPIVPKLATNVGGDLMLNIGPRATQRIAGYRPQDVERNNVSGKDEAEKVKIQAGANANEIIITAFGQTQTYSNVKRIIGDAGDFNDEITIDASVTIPTDIRGGKGDDKLQGGSGPDKLDGGEGKDDLKGGDGDDNLLGSAGTDTIDGQAGDDTIDGGAEIDILQGGAGKDTIRGGQGNDKIDGGIDDDLLFGDEGDDEIKGSGGQDVVDGGEGDDVIQGGIGADTLRGGKGRDRLQGDSGNDKLFGDEDDDTLEGGFDEDQLDGGAGNDLLLGQQGLDTLRGGDDNDVLVGGTNSDSPLRRLWGRCALCE